MRVESIGWRLSGSILALSLTACVQAPKQLYLWESFPRQQYETLLREGASPAEQIPVMEAQAGKALGADARLPPGFRAHLGMQHLAVGNDAAARQMWEAEKSAFPESVLFMDTLLKRLDGKRPPAAKGTTK